MEIKSYIKYVLCAICLLSTTAMSAQDFDELWITGSAVPGGAQKMERTPDGQFRYAGPLGEAQKAPRPPRYGYSPMMRTHSL